MAQNERELNGCARLVRKMRQLNVEAGIGH